MKKLFTFLTVISMLGLASCSSKDKTDNEANSTDTSGYKEQPQDQTQMNDTAKTMGTDTTIMPPDTIHH